MTTPKLMPTPARTESGPAQRERGLEAVHEIDRSLRVSHDGQELLRYVYQPWDAQFESPRPYFHPLRTLGGKEVSLYRPHDHVWHKGVVWSLPNVGAENFWGGPTYLRGRGYVQLENNGSMIHREFEVLAAAPERVEVSETLDWVTQAGEVWFNERRQFSISLIDDAWMLGYKTRFSNCSTQPLQLGSPTTQGRENAGYGGLFWRGPRSFTGGSVYAPGRVGGDELNGVRAPWLAFAGRHDDSGGASTLVFVDSHSNAYDGHENTEWFVRTGIYACVSPSPFYSREVEAAPGQSLEYEYAVVVADDDRGADGAADLAALAQRAL